jgi:hypothetical protein
MKSVVISVAVDFSFSGGMEMMANPLGGGGGSAS